MYVKAYNQMYTTSVNNWTRRKRQYEYRDCKNQIRTRENKILLLTSHKSMIMM